MATNSKTTTRVRSAITGQFKPDGYDKRHPNTTVREQVPKPGYGNTKPSNTNKKK